MDFYSMSLGVADSLSDPTKTILDAVDTMFDVKPDRLHDIYLSKLGKVFTFQISRESDAPGTGARLLPKIYFDRWLQENLDKRLQLQEEHYKVSQEVQELEKKIHFYTYLKHTAGNDPSVVEYRSIDDTLNGIIACLEDEPFAATPEEVEARRPTAEEISWYKKKLETTHKYRESM